ncbi:hypothetical protein ACLOAV_009347 [Pseudogymnoascus australis]
MPPQTSCAPCTLTFPTRLALRSHIRRSDSHPDCLPCHRSFLNDHALATHLTQSRFHSNSSTSHATAGSTGSARMGKRRRRRRQSGKEGVNEPATGISECGDYCEEKHTACKTGHGALNPKKPRASPFFFRRSPRRILPSRRLHALPRPVSAKRLVSAVVQKGPRYLLMLVVVVVFVMAAKGYCERFGCGYEYGCYRIMRI